MGSVCFPFYNVDKIRKIEKEVNAGGFWTIAVGRMWYFSIQERDTGSISKRVWELVHHIFKNVIFIFIS